MTVCQSQHRNARDGQPKKKSRGRSLTAQTDHTKHYTAGLLLTLTAVITVGYSATESLDSTVTSADAVPSSTSTAYPTTTTTTTTPSADTSLLTDAYPDGTWAYMGGGRCGDQAWVLDGPASDIDPEQRLNPTLITLDWGDGEWVETLQVPLNVDGSGEPAECDY